MYQSILRLNEIPWMPMFVAFVASLLLSGKYTIQLLLGKQIHFRVVEILCGVTGTAVVCYLARDVLDWWHAHSPTTPLPLWGVVPIGLAIAASSLHFKFANLRLPACDLRSSAVVWSLMLCSLGTTVWSAHRLHEEEKRDLQVLNEPAGEVNEGSLSPADVQAVTDRGRVIGLFQWQASGDSTELTRQSIESGNYAAMLIRRPDLATDTNCHGWVFAGGRYVVRGETVEMILLDNGYVPTDAPQAGDLVIHRGQTDVIGHTGLVRLVLEDGAVIEESKWGVLAGRYLHPSDSHPYGPPIYYRSPRQGHLLTIVPVDQQSKLPIAKTGLPIAKTGVSTDQAERIPADRPRETEPTIHENPPQHRIQTGASDF